MMNEITFSGISAFSYVWNKNEQESVVRRLCSAIRAGVVGCFFGYKVKMDEVNTCIGLKTHENSYFKKEVNRKIQYHTFINQVTGTIAIGIALARKGDQDQSNSKGMYKEIEDAPDEVVPPVSE